MKAEQISLASSKKDCFKLNLSNKVKPVKGINFVNEVVPEIYICLICNKVIAESISGKTLLVIAPGIISVRPLLLSCCL